MNQFVKTKLFFLIEEATERNIPLAEWKKSYKAFARAVFAASTKLERVVLHNSLRFTRAELAYRQSQSHPKKKRTVFFLH